MWLGLVMACGIKAGAAFCEYAPIVFWETERECRISVVRAALIQIKTADARDFKIGGTYADCKYVPTEGDKA